MRFARERKSHILNLNVIQMIDIMLVLLLFVLFLAKFEPEGGIAVDLPHGQSKELPTKPQVLDLVIMQNGAMFLKKEPVKIDQLATRLKQFRTSMNDPILVISADKEVPYHYIIVVTDCAKMAGQTKLNLKIKP